MGISTKDPNWDAAFAGLTILGIVYYHSLNPNRKAKLITIGIIYAVPIVMNIIGLGIFKWNY